MEREFNRKQWQRLETGRKGVSLSTLLNVCAVFEVDLATLVGGLDDGIYSKRLMPPPRCSSRRKKRANDETTL